MNILRKCRDHRQAITYILHQEEDTHEQVFNIQIFYTGVRTQENLHLEGGGGGVRATKAQESMISRLAMSEFAIFLASLCSLAD